MAEEPTDSSVNRCRSSRFAIHIYLMRRLETFVHKFCSAVQLRVVLSFMTLLQFTELIFIYRQISLVVYSIHCNNCGPSKAYIGKTKTLSTYGFMCLTGISTLHHQKMCSLGIWTRTDLASLIQDNSSLPW